MSSDGNQKNPNKKRATWNFQTLDSTQRLAVYILGALALQHMELAALIDDSDREALYFLYQDTTNAIRQALPHLDMVELNRFSTGDFNPDDMV